MIDLIDEEDEPLLMPPGRLFQVSRKAPHMRRMPLRVPPLLQRAAVADAAMDLVDEIEVPGTLVCGEGGDVHHDRRDAILLQFGARPNDQALPACRGARTNPRLLRRQTSRTC